MPAVFSSLLNHVRIAVRALRHPARFALTAVALLGLGPARMAATADRLQPSTNTITFVGSTPCDAAIKSLMALPSDPCDFIRWRLRLDSGEPHGFSLAVAFGAAQPNTLDFIGGGRTVLLRGKVQVRRPARPAQSVEIYQLDGEAAGSPISLLRLNENLLQVLQADGTPMVGNGGWSYTLNREAPVASTPNPRFWLGLQPETSDGSTVFEGRTPCREIAGRIGLADQAGCFKVKWKLTLIRDPKTRQPARYTLDRTGHRGAPVEGRWRISDSERGGDGPRIYQLDPDSRGASLSFVAVDSSLLFFLDRQGQLLTGNADFSYTLNKRAK